MESRPGSMSAINTKIKQKWNRNGKKIYIYIYFLIKAVVSRDDFYQFILEPDEIHSFLSRIPLTLSSPLISYGINGLEKIKMNSVTP